MHLLAREEAGLRCLLQVALSGASGGPVPIAQIASREGISGVYAAKLMRQLRLAGLVESTRGAAGGYLLSRPAERITVWDAIRALDESFLPESDCACTPTDRLDCRRTTSCAVSSLWRRLGDEIRSELDAVTLAELCGGALDRPDHVVLPIVDRPSTSSMPSEPSEPSKPFPTHSTHSANRAASGRSTVGSAEQAKGHIRPSAQRYPNHAPERNQPWPNRA